ncbi:CDP-glycerol glycerophosphotransferase family protein [Microlunatus sp. Gsoil 973]|uniref:CDP-glycerol glycerophosphotransferase family protein n=1 Tax=Microlunatus sp. Gsoil 973 TaxID=2672569 RepID=UPI0012B4AFCD|nr:CDP-glycerol glycerophosphotransferase family protein [Microlunatus sp. Gsoil 973]QGN32461.1 hypothetical protein GJV80_06220 [Microlunatus sp. Gsoil 973]
MAGDSAALPVRLARAGRSRLVNRARRFARSARSRVSRVRIEMDRGNGSAQQRSAELTSRLGRVSWLEVDGVAQLRLEGSAWRRGGEQSGSQISAVEWKIDGESIPFAVRPVTSAALNDQSLVPTEDRSSAGFIATLPVSRLLALAPTTDVFELRGPVMITVSDQQGLLEGPFGKRDVSGSAGQPTALGLGDDCLGQLSWHSERGLLLTLTRRAAVARRIRISATTLQADVTVAGGFEPVGAVLSGIGTAVTHPLTFGRAAELVRISGDLTGLPAPERPSGFQLALVDAAGRRRRVHWTGSADALRQSSAGAEAGLALRYGPGAVIQVETAPVRADVDSVDVVRADDATPRLVITGGCRGVPDDPKSWQLQGGRRREPARALQVDGDSYRAEFDLVGNPEWSDQLRPLPSATYRLMIDLTPGSDAPATAAPQQRLIAELPRVLTTPQQRVTVGRGGSGELEIALDPPLPDGARSRFSRYRLGELYSNRPMELADAVLFTSFDGTAANDNPRAIEREILRRGSALRRLWTVADLSVGTPDGSEPVLLWSEEWWQALASSRFVVTNCWMPTRFRRREGQQVLQTWHGTPLKLLGYDRLGVKRGAEYRDKTAREVAQWRFLIAQNDFSSTAFRSAYDYRGEILRIGYPRNDVLTTATDDYRAGVRRRLGIDDSEFVVLYTPTWRDGLRTIFADLDLQATRRAIGGRARMLVRGHTNTIRHSGLLTGPGLLDVTMYPEVSDLYLISDLMITDYSSTMFDFSVTGKPMIFYSPDLDDYAGRRRGTYFDLAAEAPGPVVRTTGELLDTLGDRDGIAERHGDRYAAWQQKFNAYDDGHAAERAVDALFGPADLSDADHPD